MGQENGHSNYQSLWSRAQLDLGLGEGRLPLDQTEVCVEAKLGFWWWDESLGLVKSQWASVLTHLPLCITAPKNLGEY